MVSLSPSSPTSSTNPTNPTSPVSSAINTQPQAGTLGTGITVPGMSIAPQPRPRAAVSAGAREQARRDALQTGVRAEQKVQSEQEKQQNDAIASMGTVPGFDAYQSAKLPDAQFYAARDIYRNATIPDNRRAQRALSERSDRIHQEMVNQQYGSKQ